MATIIMRVLLSTLRPGTCYLNDPNMANGKVCNFGKDAIDDDSRGP